MRHLLRRAAVTGIALAAVLGAASPASAAPDKPAGTLTIVNDESTVGSSSILSWQWGITNPVGTGSAGGGAGSGKAVLQAFTVAKRVDPLSTELTRSTATGSHFDEAVISVPIGNPGTPFTIEYKLRQVFVETVQQSGSADESFESVSLKYGAFQQQIGTTSQFGWANEG